MEQLISVRSLFKETDAYAGKQIKVGGWVRNLRASKNFGFINLSDGTFFSQVQVVYGSELANFTEISKLNIGAAVIVTGTLVRRRTRSSRSSCRPARSSSRVPLRRIIPSSPSAIRWSICVP